MEPRAAILEPIGNDRDVVPPMAGLTLTQLRVLRCVRLGLANKQIAYELGMAEATVKVHMTALMRKLNVRNRTQAAIAATAFVTRPEYLAA